MNAGDFNELLRKAPFRPLRLTLTTGIHHDINHPEFAVLGKTIVWIHSPDGPSIVVSLLHIIQVTFLDRNPQATVIA
jgi:hypothetical protein